MPEPLLETRGLTKRFGGLVATDAAALSVESGELHAVIGPNGAGKTTLIAELSGELLPDAGSIRFAGRDITRLGMPRRVALGIARSFQVTSVFDDLTALDNVALAVQAHAGHSFRLWRDARRDARLSGPARAMLAEVAIGERADVPAATLSHGEKRALEVAMVLATQPRLLLLDEPMAGLALDESQAMTRMIAKLKGSITVLLVEHDMTAVFELADRISVLVSGRIIASGAPQEIRTNAEVRRAYLGDELAA